MTLAYRYYISEGVRLITKNTATFEGAEMLKIGFGQFIRALRSPQETRTSDDIINHMKERLNALEG